MALRAQIIVKGIVQGVGFRPFVYNLAGSLKLKGFVTNTSDGVFIDAEGPALPEFIEKLRDQAPPLSEITDVSVSPLPFHGYSDFTIRKSADQGGRLPFTLISPDVSICDDCLRELRDPANRRYLYPFINCTNCGPRYSITKAVPYDRPNTTMADFTLCPECSKEYHNPEDRRFHAQPNACFTCGPQVTFELTNAAYNKPGHATGIAAAIELLKQGGIVAVKGLGGFHIACDASNDSAVKRLREKKRKSNKPFAVMAPSLQTVQEFCVVSEEEQGLLLSNRRPVVLLAGKEGAFLSAAVSPQNRFIGVMLPYTPLHQLLFYHPLRPGRGPETPHFTALVMTSGNLSEEPIVRDNREALEKLSGLVDGFLFHNRDIFMRVDDSVVRIAELNKNSPTSAAQTSKPNISFIRRSRGYAPDAIRLHDDGPEVLGCGADLKNTFTLTKGPFAVMSQHIGDVENYETIKFFEESLANLKAVYRADPKTIVHDLHPGYLSTKWAMEQESMGREREVGESAIPVPHAGIRLFGIQHHYAHIGSVMAENGLKREVIGVAFDGTGYGTDGNLWGGEFLIAGIETFERAAHFNYLSLPGGEAAIREPWKTAVSLIMQVAGPAAWDFLGRIGFIEKYGRDSVEKIMMVARSRELSPLSSGAGRLFDAVSALLGVCDKNTFEGEAAMALEACTREGIEAAYEFRLIEDSGMIAVDFGPAVMEIMNEMVRATSRESMAVKFHNTVVAVIQTIVRRIRADRGIHDVALSGGVFQNQYLLNRAVRLLSEDGFSVFANRKVPCNDGGISLGQAYLVRERLKNRESIGL